MKTKELLAAEHLNRNLEIITNIIERYNSLEVKKVKDTFSAFCIQHNHDIVSGFSKSMIEALHEAKDNGFDIDNDFLQSLDNANQTTSIVLKATIDEMYDNLPVN